MRTFHFYIDDRRCGAPRSLTVQARDEARAEELARVMLANSRHHIGIEVCEDGRRLFGLGSFAHRSWCEPAEPPRAAAG
jgi:hypothetical protein